MIEGAVNDDLEPTISISLVDTFGHAHEVHAILDTGFNGELALPPDLIEQTGLEAMGVRIAEMGDGRSVTLAVFAGRVSWDDAVRSVLVLSGAAPLIGMSLLRDHRLYIDVSPGGTVTVDAEHERSTQE